MALHYRYKQHDICSNAESLDMIEQRFLKPGGIRQPRQCLGSGTQFKRKVLRQN